MGRVESLQSKRWGGGVESLLRERGGGLQREKREVGGGRELAE